MTLFYSDQVATCRRLGNFGKLLFRWKGSIYKVLWAEILIYLICYYALNAFYRLYLTRKENCAKKSMFIKFVSYCETHGKEIPMAFVLGFYVGIIVDRWWKQWMELPWPDTIQIQVATVINGHDTKARLLRRTIMRYVNLCFVLCVSRMSVDGNKRFPTLDHVVEAGFMLDHERTIMENIRDANSFKAPVHWMPLVWAGELVRRARREGRIRDDISANTLVASIMNFRHGCQKMLNYDWVNVPLAYTQVVTLAVYLYFIASLFSNQITVSSADDEPIDLFFPFFGFFEFFFYMGWLKVAEVLINPYGLDDDDFEISWMINRFFEVAYIVVDEMHQEHPNLLKDQYWDDVVPLEIPYTETAAKEKAAVVNEQLGSAKDYEVPIEKQEFVKPGKSDATLFPARMTIAHFGSTTLPRGPVGRASGRATVVSQYPRTRAQSSEPSPIYLKAQELAAQAIRESIDVQDLMEPHDVVYVPSSHEHLSSLHSGSSGTVQLNESEKPKEDHLGRKSR